MFDIKELPSFMDGVRCYEMGRCYVYTSQTDLFLITIVTYDGLPSDAESKFALDNFVPKGMKMKQIFMPHMSGQGIQFIEDRVLC
jgi:hypothetical protein